MERQNRRMLHTIKYLVIAAAIVGCTSLSGVAAEVEKSDNNVNGSDIKSEQTVTKAKTDSPKLKLENPVFIESDDADTTISQEAERVYGDESVFELLGN